MISPQHHRLSLLILISGLLALAIPHGFAEFQIWTDRYGRQLEAEIMDLTPEAATIRDRQGTTAQVPLTHFSRADQRILRDYVENPPEPELAETEFAEPEEPMPVGDGKPWRQEVQEIAEALNDGAPPVGLAEGRKLEQQTAEENVADGRVETPEATSAEASPEDSANPEPLLAAASGFSAATFSTAPDNLQTLEQGPDLAETPEDDGSSGLPTVIPYQVIAGWQVPNNQATSQRILISPAHATKEFLQILGANLLETHSEISYADIMVFTSKEMASLEREDYTNVSPEQSEEISRHYVARFIRDMGRGIVELELFPARPGANTVINLQSRTQTVTPES